jgi:hypothetical protein
MNKGKVCALVASVALAITGLAVFYFSQGTTSE